LLLHQLVAQLAATAVGQKNTVIHRPASYLP
jgi:hypothetical protein